MFLATRRLSLTVLVLASVAVAARADDAVQVRDGLANCFRVVTAAQTGLYPARMVWLGGAVTKGQGASRENRCYRALVTAEIRRLTPKMRLVEFDHSLAGEGSWLAAFRAATDVVQHYMPLSLVVVELAVDDAAEQPERGQAALEGLVRQIRRAHPQADLLFVYPFSRPASPAIAWHERIAAHYQIPSVNLARLVEARLASGQLTLDQFGAEGLHPTDRGHALYAEAIRSLLQSGKASASGAPVKHVLPKPLCANAMEQARTFPYELADLEPGWQTGQENTMDDQYYRSAVGRFRSLLVCDRPGPTATLRFRGDTVGVFGEVGPDSGALEFSLDGGPWQCKAFQPSPQGLRPQAMRLADGLATGEHQVRLRVAAQTPAGSTGRCVRIGYFLVNGQVDDRFKGLTPLERIDAVYRQMAPVKYAPPADRWQLIPKTMARLQRGPTLRIVMLGDSIVSDTASSQYELLLERMYPRCKVTKIRSVRGSTGCWWYKDEGRVNEWVLKHEPDLLMIGGISQRDDVDSIREVIRQVRAARPQVEILVMTPVFGTYDPRADKQWAYDLDADGPSYRSRLKRMAAEEKVEFVNMTGPWGEYLRASDKTRGWFMRDPVHSNERGQQILGRILERYFAPR
jgi:lysophospholipase L1-like esterase